MPNLAGEIGEPTWGHNELDYVAPLVLARLVPEGQFEAIPESEF